MDLMGVGHPLVDALISHYRSDAISGDVLKLKNDGIPDFFSVRYLFMVNFEDGIKKELYKEFILSGSQMKSDVELLMQQEWKENHAVSNLKETDEQISLLIRNFEAQLRSECEGILNVRTTCVGIMHIYR
ncbi:MAG: helicase [Candidatus Brocadia fulgida]|uniref:Helicase n=1 Tax=Candidatus Brocadia fulgida TaxID=380242 RepID=A0A0M2UV58_9BACT|nr:MAG: helicase [Candidatus Brocadia fulgida]